MSLFGISFLLALLFLIWSFFLTTMTHSLTRLGETRASEILRKYPGRFFYAPIHRFLFKFSQFELLIFSSTLGENIARLGYVAFGAIGIATLPFQTITTVVITLLVLLFLVLLIGDFFPRLWATWTPEQALANSLPFASFFLYISLPISLLFLKLAEWVTRVRHKEKWRDSLEETKESIVQILQEAEVKGPLNASDKKLIESVVKFKERIVREVMVPRVDLFCLSAETTIRDAAKSLISEGYSRIPVYRETIDNIIGVLMFKDILQLDMDCLEGKKIALFSMRLLIRSQRECFILPKQKRQRNCYRNFAPNRCIWPLSSMNMGEQRVLSPWKIS